MHGGAVSLGRHVGEWSARQSELERGKYLPDVLFASDMLDLPVFLATARDMVAGTPAIVYFHENQLTYPLSPDVDRDLSYGFKNLTSALVAQTVLFNSAYHKREFLDACHVLFAEMPDEVPSWALEEIEAKSHVLPVGCDLRRLESQRSQAMEDASAGRWGDPQAGPLILWNQRWEYDKAPVDVFDALCALKRLGIRFRIAIAGSNQGMPSAEFLRARDELADEIVQWGRIEKVSEYASLLWAADVVVSTAYHEFFGISIVEAMYCGCRPVLPRRLSYPEIVPSEVHEDVLYGQGELVAALERALAQPRAWSEDWQRTWVARFDWGCLKNRYDEEVWRCWSNAMSMSNRSRVLKG